MKLVMPVWEGRISPLFDVARELLVIVVEEGREQNRQSVPLQEEWLPFRVRRLADLGVKVLICGGISRALADLLQTAGITVIAQIKGEPDQVLNAYLSGNLAAPRFAMPGAGRIKAPMGGTDVSPP